MSSNELLDNETGEGVITKSPSHKSNGTEASEVSLAHVIDNKISQACVENL